MSKKWTKWIPTPSSDTEEWDCEEEIKIKLPSGAVARGAIESLIGLGPFTHYKRLKKNVGAEEGETGGLTLSAEAAREAGFDIDEDILIKDPIDVCLRTIDSLYELDLPDTIKGELVLVQEALNRELRRQPETAENNASEPENAEMGINPTPIITGPGEYMTRDGRKAVVSFMDENSGFPFFGKVGDQDSSWTVDGSYWGVAASNADITGPWQEPEAEAEKPERWANLYRGEGYIFLGSNFDSREQCSEHLYTHFPHIGTVLLNPEEE